MSRRRTKAEIQRIISDIRQLIQENVPADQIRHTLGLELRQYQRFAKTINQENQAIWRELVKGELAGEFLKLRSSLENSYQTTLTLLETPGLDTEDTLAALRAKDGMRLDICNLLYEGTALLTQQQQEQQLTKQRKGQSSIMMQQLQPHP